METLEAMAALRSKFFFVFPLLFPFLIRPL